MPILLNDVIVLQYSKMRKAKSTLFAINKNKNSYFTCQNDQLAIKKLHINQHSVRIVSFCKIHVEVL